MNLIDTHIAVALAHCLFNVPLAVWILEGFMSGIPKEIDETAFVDGYSFPRFFFTLFIPLIRAGVGVTAFFCFMFSWVELLLAKTLTSVEAKPIAAVMTRTASSSGYELGLLAAAGTLTWVKPGGDGSPESLYALDPKDMAGLMVRVRGLHPPEIAGVVGQLAQEMPRPIAAGVAVHAVEFRVARHFLHEGEEFIFVLDGEVILEIGEDKFELEPGDSAYYLSTTAHHIAAKNGKATILAVMYDA